MMKNTLKTLFALMLISIFSLANAQTDTEQTKQTRISSNDIYHVTIESLLKPLKLGQMHAWKASIQTADGKPVKDVSIKVSGGMPIHNHGFPTQPEMTKQIEPGVYLIEGFKFSMGGPWIILLDISTDSQSDTVAFDINM